MDTARTTNRCPVYLHPAAANNPATIEASQRRTGMLVITCGPHLAKLGKAQPSTLALTDTDFDPWGGSAA